MSTPPAPRLLRCIQFFHYRWSVPIVANLHTRRRCRFAELRNILGASRDTLADTIASLVTNGLVVRVATGKTAASVDYALSPAGDLVGEACVAAVAAVRAQGLVEVALKKWPMLVIIAIGRGAPRYGEMHALLPGVTSRALAMALKDLEATNLVERRIGRGYPPTVTYHLTPLGQEIFPVMDALAVACEQVPPPGEAPQA